MTKTEMFKAIRDNLTDSEQIAFIDHEIEMLAKRNANRSSKPSKAQLEKDAQRQQIIEFLGENEKATCGEVAEALGVTLHSATGLLTTLRKGGLVKREYEGKTPVYSLGSEVADE
jgi:DNA-binding transcriptional ArsR family regulator